VLIVCLDRPEADEGLRGTGRGLQRPHRQPGLFPDGSGPGIDRSLGGIQSQVGPAVPNGTKLVLTQKSPF